MHYSKCWTECTTSRTFCRECGHSCQSLPEARRGELAELLSVDEQDVRDYHPHYATSHFSRL